MGRLSELLDRFRPAGGPGPSSASGGPAAVEHDVEAAAILAELRHLETEVAAIVAEAQARADQTRAEAAARAQTLLASLPEACAAARAAAGVQRGQAIEVSLADMAADADAEIERIGAVARERCPEIVADVVAAVRGSAAWAPAH